MASVFRLVRVVAVEEVFGMGIFRFEVRGWAVVLFYVVYCLSYCCFFFNIVVVF